MSNPLLTVVLPVHNGMPYLDAAVRSLLVQTYSNIKIIAIDDGSTDGSSEYLDAIHDARLTVIHQKRAGLGAVLNRGIDLCDTPFLARMDADDVSLPQRFELQMARMQKEPDLVAISSPLDFLVHNTVQRGLPYPVEHDRIVHDLLQSGASLCHPGLLMRAEAARATRYRIAGAGEDLDFCLRLAEYGRVSNLDVVQYHYRLHHSSISMTKRAELERGYAYAAHTALERRQGHSETSFAAFSQAWSERGLGSRIRSWRVSLSLSQYRRARLAWAQRKRGVAVSHMAVSTLLQPMKSAGVAIRKLGAKRGMKLQAVASHS